MIKKNVAIIGRGRWGLILKKKLKNISNLIFVTGKNYQNKNYKNIDWVFIVTPDSTHKHIINYFLKKKINVFCEKPLLRDFNSAKIILKNFKKKKIKIYISDVLIYLKKKIKFKKINKIFRSKNANYKFEEILYRLTYHDIYFCSDLLQERRLRVSKNFKQRKLELNIKTKKKNFNFVYNLKKNKKEHLYNSQNISSGQDPLKNMLITILYKKPNYSKNHKRSLFTLKLIDKIKKI